jgi:hypothetical protein
LHNPLIEVFRSWDLSWDLRKRFSDGVFRHLGMFTFPFSADVWTVRDLIKSHPDLRIDLKVARKGIVDASKSTTFVWELHSSHDFSQKSKFRRYHQNGNHNTLYTLGLATCLFALAAYFKSKVPKDFYSGL